MGAIGPYAVHPFLCTHTFSLHHATALFRLARTIPPLEWYVSFDYVRCIVLPTAIGTPDIFELQLAVVAIATTLAKRVIGARAAVVAVAVVGVAAGAALTCHTLTPS
jgi:hypothetical protein